MTQYTMNDPLEEAMQRASGCGSVNAAMLPPMGVEREITDRPKDTASVAVVRCLAFGPPVFKTSPPSPALNPSLTSPGLSTNPVSQSSSMDPLGSFFVGTSGGIVMAYSLFIASRSIELAASGSGTASAAKQLPSSPSAPDSLLITSPHLAVKPAKELILHHRAPVISLRLIDTRTYDPLPINGVCIYPDSFILRSKIYYFSSSYISSDSIIHMCSGILMTHHPSVCSAGHGNHASSVPPHLLVLSEEQVRLFSLPGLNLRQKARITAKDGYRIKTGALVGFLRVSLDATATENSSFV
ncbi:unnamed protein product [Protopolystoma xenopodis]|uniref:Uncharacterized protein n=1 Tax=Protopolystoma xenopodis TaxID=117903 RepID=A0A3S5C6T0_9PLAT|nr:unnamed protein product [Protopolystoma xenopodis]